MSRFKLILVVLAVGAGLVAAVPAEAASHAHADVVGSATTNPGMGYPGVFPAVTGGQFTLGSSLLCVDNGAHALKGPSPVTPEFGPTCSLNGSGTINGNCGSASGDLSGTFTSSFFRVYNFTGGFQIAGSTFEFNGWATQQSSGQAGPIAIAGQLVPNPLAGTSCAAGTQRSWLLTGTVEIAAAL